MGKWSSERSSDLVNVIGSVKCGAAWAMQSAHSTQCGALHDVYYRDEHHPLPGGFGSSELALEDTLAWGNTHGYSSQAYLSPNPSTITYQLGDLGQVV